jgi:tetratricopeptide (TPR) repeat protein
LERAYPEAARPWEVTDRIATLRLHLGDPHAARRAWMAAVDPPRPALVASRIGMAALALDDFAAARRSFQEATRLDPDLFEAWYGLAITEQDAARSTPAVEAAARARQVAPNDLAREAAVIVERLARPSAEDQARSNRRISDGFPTAISRRASSSTAAPSPRPSDLPLSVTRPRATWSHASELHALRVEVGVEREGVPSLEPAEVSPSTPGEGRRVSWSLFPGSPEALRAAGRLSGKPATQGERRRVRAFDDAADHGRGPRAAP